MRNLPQVLTIAFSDCGGGAGVQADIKTIHANGAYAVSVMAGITAQNTRRITQMESVNVELLESQIDAVFEDFNIQATKIGMLYRKEVVDLVSDKLRTHAVKNLVVDPIMSSTTGTVLLAPNAIEGLKRNLFPLATLVTPNIPEAEKLSGVSIRTLNHLKEAARRIQKLGSRGVLITGGHFQAAPATDLFFDGDKDTSIDGRWIRTSNTHGTGCAYSSAIAAQLASGKGLLEAILAAKEYLTKALEHGLSIGRGVGPFNHFFGWDQEGG